MTGEELIAKGPLAIAQVREVALKHHQHTKMTVFVGGIDQDFVDRLNELVTAALPEIERLARLDEAKWWHAPCECNGRYCLGQNRVNGLEDQPVPATEESEHE